MRKQLNLKEIFTLKNFERLLLVGLLVYSVILGATVGFMYESLKKLTGIKELEYYKPSIPTKIFDVKNRLISEYFVEQREIVDYNKIPENLINAVIAVEDNDFYHHRGINFQGIIRAFFVNIIAGKIKEGGSTITQQLAKILFTSRRRTYFRKLKEAWLALQIEKLYTKKEILTFYLNQVYLGHGAYGVESASRLYFNKHVNQLNLAECAMLAGLPAAPNKYSPLRNPDTAQKRQWKVLKNMISLGYITKKDAKDAFYDFWMNYQNKVISPNLSIWKIREDKAPYFTEYIRRKMEKEFGKSALYKEGLRIYTTLDLDYQKDAQESLWQQLKKQNEIYYKNITRINNYFDKNFTDLISLLGIVLNDEKIEKLTALKEIHRINTKFKNEYMDKIDEIALLFGLDNLHQFITEYRNKIENKKFSDKVEGALIAIDPRNGYIKAMVGGSGFSPDNQLNRAIQSHRQPGSAFKPFVYITALDTGEYTPASTFMDEPIVYIDKDGKEWIPNNYSGKYYGLVTLRKALQHSINIISVKLADQIGIDKVRNLAARMLHIYSFKERKKYLPDDLSLALGTASVTPLQMANAFAIIANEGKDVIPISIRYITDRNGNLIKNYEQKIKKKPKDQVITPQIAFLITDMLKSILKPGGTGWGAVVRTKFNLIAAGKTGTTDNWKDTWFVGFNKYLATAVWIGFDNPQKSLGVGQDAGHVAAPVWMRFFMKVFKNKYVPDYTPPDGIVQKVICLYSGKLPSNYCKEVGPEYFLKGTEPTEVCTECKNANKKYELDEKAIEALIEKQREEKKSGLFFKRKKRLKLLH